LANTAPFPEARRSAPEIEQHDNDRQCHHLADLDTDVERDQVDQQAVVRPRQVLQLGRQPEPVEQPEHQHRELGVDGEADPLEPAEVLERLVNHREADDRVDDIRVEAGPEEHAGEQRGRVADGEHRDVDDDVTQPVEEEDHPDQEQDVVDPGDHVLGAEIQERHRRRAVDALDVRLVGL
jgi:hypothetical protein